MPSSARKKEPHPSIARPRVRRSSRTMLSASIFFNDTATTEIYTLSLHDALPISLGTYSGGWRIMRTLGRRIIHLDPPRGFAAETTRSEEHTSELQSRGHLVC